MMTLELNTPTTTTPRRVLVDGRWHREVQPHVLVGLGTRINLPPTPGPGWATARIDKVRFAAWIGDMA